MKREFELGERIVYYHGGGRFIGNIKAIHYTYQDKTKLDYFVVSYSKAYQYINVHPKQCRHLKPKALPVAAKRRRLYAIIPDYGVNSVSAFFDKKLAKGFSDDKDVTTFIEEVRRD